MRDEEALSRLLRTAAVALGVTAAGCGSDVPTLSLSARASADPVSTFLETHWRFPLRASAEPPLGSEKDLAPAACGGCHPAQFAEWRSSLHGRAMGPGVVGQFGSMDRHERESCQRCHAPLDEQREASSPLHRQGVTCAACHQRNGRVFGPVSRDGRVKGDSPEHGEWTASAAFEDSRFCATCHQFDAAGLALEDKPLENTLEEWKGSRHAREGRSCQSCHMRNRGHLWRGIHDAQMTRAALTIEHEKPRVEMGRLRTGWRIVNSGAGHAFPTYVTPKVVATIRQEARGGKRIRGTAVDFVIAREIAPDLTRELADTRLAPDEARRFDYDMARHPSATHVVLEIRVEPDAFYTELYRSLLKGDPRNASIREALASSIASRYRLLIDRQALD